MILEQSYLGCLAQASYLVACERTGRAVVVDPRRDVDVYQGRAAELGVRITHVLLTHFHADFVSGHLELAQRAGAEIALGAAAKPAYAHRALEDGEVLELGDVRIVALATPGHTPESTCYLVFDRTRDPERPRAVLTGDTLFIGDVGRPDLMASAGWRAEDLACLLYDSLRAKLLPLPDETLVYPGHGAGSMCGKALSAETSATLGSQRATNWALQEMSKAEFVALVTEGQPDPPDFFPANARANREERATLDETLRDAERALELDDVLARRAAGTRVLDTRAADAFAARHLAGSLNVPLDGSFATWAGTLVERERDVVIVADEGREREAALRLGRVGHDRVVGCLAGGVRALEGRSDVTVRSGRLAPEELARELTRATPPLVLDVRTDAEWAEGHLAESLHVPLRRLPERLGEVPRERAVVCLCRSGYRSAAAASLLAREGFAGVRDLAGGIVAWREAGLPTTQPVGTGS